MTREQMKLLREKKTTNQMKASDIHRYKTMSTVWGEREQMQTGCRDDGEQTHKIQKKYSKTLS